MVGLAATSIGSGSIANLDAGADIARAGEGGKEVILHLALFAIGCCLAVVDAVEVTAGTLVVVTEPASTVDANDWIYSIILASSAFGASITRIGSTGAVGSHI